MQDFFPAGSAGKCIECPHCDVSLSLHRGGPADLPLLRLRDRRSRSTCPSCGSRRFCEAFGIGTQQAGERWCQRAFPEARILRMDLDTTREKDGHEKILAAFADGEADILIGTQMIVKGHDFPGCDPGGDSGGGPVPYTPAISGRRSGRSSF